jgi:4'-phosphopantetheinyl transferase
MRGGSVAIAVVAAENKAAETLLSRWITSEDQAHARKYRRPDACRRSLLAHAALRALLARQTAGSQWVFAFDAVGKLRVRTDGGMATAEGSISHSHGMIACAVNHTGPIGIDIEAHRLRAHDAIARYGFGPGEQAQIARGGMRAFYRIWTLREAIGKSTGQGLALATDGRDYVAPDPEQGCWVARHQGDGWRLAHYVLTPAYSLALAVPGAECDWRPEMIEWVDLLG